MNCLLNVLLVTGLILHTVILVATLVDTSVSEEYAASFFRAEVCRMRNWLLHRQVEKKLVTHTNGME